MAPIPPREEERALEDVRRAVEKDLVRGRARAEIVRDLMAGGVRRVEAEDIVSRAQKGLLSGRAPAEAVPHTAPPPAPPAPEAVVPLAPVRTAVPRRATVTAAPRRARPRRLAIAAAAVGLVAAGIALGPAWVGRRLAMRGERQALDDLRAFAAANAGLATLNGGAFVPPEVLADPSRLPAGAPPAPAHLRDGRRDAYVFRFLGDQPVASARTQPAFRAYAYVATPAETSRGLRSFAIYSYVPGIYARGDGGPPTVADEALPGS